MEVSFEDPTTTNNINIKVLFRSQSINCTVKLFFNAESTKIFGIESYDPEFEEHINSIFFSTDKKINRFLYNYIFDSFRYTTSLLYQGNVDSFIYYKLNNPHTLRIVEFSGLPILVLKNLHWNIK